MSPLECLERRWTRATMILLMLGCWLTLRRAVGRPTGKDGRVTGIVDHDARRDELRTALSRVHARIDAARAASGRTDAVALVVVTKTFPASDVDLLADLGVTDVGENRNQEAAAKRGECGVSAQRLSWHMIGQLQRNKARSVVAWADMVESVDRAALVTALGTAAQEAGRCIDALIQVNLDPEPTPGRGGALPAEVPGLADLIADQQALRLAGLMGVAPHPDGLPADSARAAFERLAVLAEQVRKVHPGAHVISAGMSGDLEEAIAAGATQVRIGGAVLGTRPRVE